MRVVRIIETAEQLAEIMVGDVGKDSALTAITNGTVGIATRNVKGYTPTNIGLAEYDYHKLEDICDKANELLFPGRDPKESYMIVLTSMRK